MIDLTRSFLQLAEDDWLDREQDKVAHKIWRDGAVQSGKPGNSPAARHLKIGHLIGQLSRLDPKLADRIQAHLDGTGGGALGVDPDRDESYRFPDAAWAAHEAMKAAGAELDQVDRETEDESRDFSAADYDAFRQRQRRASSLLNILKPLFTELHRAGGEQGDAHYAARKAEMPSAAELAEPRDAVPSNLAGHEFKPELPSVKVTDTPEGRKLSQDIAAAARLPVRFVDFALQMAIPMAATAAVGMMPGALVGAAGAAMVAPTAFGAITSGLFDYVDDAAQTLSRTASELRAAGKRATPSEFATKAAGPLSRLLKRTGLFDSAPTFGRALVDRAIGFRQLALTERQMFKTGSELPKLSAATLAKRLRAQLAATDVHPKLAAPLEKLAKVLADDPDDEDMRTVVQWAQRFLGAHRKQLPPKVRAVVTLIGDASMLKGAPKIGSAVAVDTFVDRNQVAADRWFRRIGDKELEEKDYDQLLDVIKAMIGEMAEGRLLDPKVLRRIRLWAGDAVQSASAGDTDMGRFVVQVPHQLLTAVSGSSIQARRAIGWFRKLEDWNP